ncbi:MAG: hypothetical protein PHZ19_02795 [Candidatus Thermoplasmatota archaeon]|nr:hypothetical protein [Candidatus Thermoplasmatota archaeon]
MKLFNEHEHDEVKKGGDKSGPPVQKMTCAEHLSHVVFTIKDPWDQPKSPFQEKIISVGKKFLEAPAKGTPKTDEQPAPPPPPSEEEPPSEEQVEPEKPRKKKTLLDSVDKFCKNPGGVIGDAAKGAGVPEEAVDCAQSAINSGIKSAINAGVTAVENTIGIDLPDMDSACEVVGKIKEGKWLGALADVAKQAVKTVLPAVVTGVTAGLVPPAVTTAVLNGVEKVLDMGGSKEDAAACAAAVAEAAGGTPCEGLTALGGIVNSGVVAELVESL